MVRYQTRRQKHTNQRHKNQVMLQHHGQQQNANTIDIGTTTSTMDRNNTSSLLIPVWISALRTAKRWIETTPAIRETFLLWDQFGTLESPGQTHMSAWTVDSSRNISILGKYWSGNDQYNYNKFPMVRHGPCSSSGQYLLSCRNNITSAPWTAVFKSLHTLATVFCEHESNKAYTHT